MGIIYRLKQAVGAEKISGDSSTVIIAGLGNPGKEYTGTRHNCGFEVLDRISKEYNIPIVNAKFRALVGSGRINGVKVLLLKPQTFMNKSGESIRAALDFYKIDPKTNLIVVYDDVSLLPGRIRVRPQGSAGGHNGIKNIICHLAGSNEFQRVRVGIGEKPEHYDMADYVLGHFDKKEKALMNEAFDLAGNAAVELLTKPIQEVMSRYNGK